MPQTRTKRPLVARLVMALAALGLFFFGYQWGNQFQRTGDDPARIQGVLLRPPVPLPRLNMQGSAGELSIEDLQGQWSLLAFGSPSSVEGHRAVARMVEVWNRMADQPTRRERLMLLLISADDAPGLARDFERLSPHLRVLSIDRPTLAGLQHTLGTAPSTGPSSTAGPTPDTALDADSVSAQASRDGPTTARPQLNQDPPPNRDAAEPPPLLLIGPNARVLALFPGGQPAQAIATDLAALFDHPPPASVPSEADDHD